MAELLDIGFRLFLVGATAVLLHAVLFGWGYGGKNDE
jgi:hypothetical protein